MGGAVDIRVLLWQVCQLQTLLAVWQLAGTRTPYSGFYSAVIGDYSAAYLVGTRDDVPERVLALIATPYHAGQRRWRETMERLEGYVNPRIDTESKREAGAYLFR